MNKLVNFVKKYKQENPSGWRKWVFGALAVTAVLILVAVYALRAFFKGRELARLKHERDLALEAAHQAEVDRKLNLDKEAQQEHMREAEEALAEAKEIEVEIKRLTTQHEENKAVIDSIRSWDDVDRIVK